MIDLSSAESPSNYPHKGEEGYICTIDVTDFPATRSADPTLQSE